MKTRITWVHLILILSSLILILPACQKDPLSSTFDEQSALLGNQRLKASPNFQNLDKLLALITEKVQSGEIPKGIGNSLTAKVNSAKSSIAKGQLKAAENVLKAFTNQVTDLISQGVLSEALGGQLSQLAYEVFNPPTWKCGDNFTDARDGHVYKSVQIGNQCWMGENLAYLPHVSPPKIQGGIWVYDYEGNDPIFAASLFNYKEYGCLYNWNTATSDLYGNGKDICPIGWHVPSDDELTSLANYLGGQEIAGIKLKEAGTAHWLEGNIKATNESGFTALPAGILASYGAFVNLGYNTSYWSDLEFDPIMGAWRRYLNIWTDGFIRQTEGKIDGMSVRCLKD